MTQKVWEIKQCVITKTITCVQQEGSVSGTKRSRGSKKSSDPTPVVIFKISTSCEPAKTELLKWYVYSNSNDYQCACNIDIKKKS